METDVVGVIDAIVVNFISGSVTQSGNSTFDGVVVVVDVVAEPARDCLKGGGLTVLKIIAFILSSEFLL